MREQIEGQAGIRQHHLFEEGVEITFVIAEAADVAVVAPLQEPSRTALAAHIEGGDPETFGRQVADRLEIFLNIFVAAVQDDDRALGDLGAGAKNGITQPVAVMPFE